MYYTTFDWAIGKLRGGKNDIANDIGAAVLSGTLFRATSGLRAILQVNTLFVAVTLGSLYAMNRLKKQKLYI